MKSTLLIVTATVALFSALPQNASAHHSEGNTPKSHGNMTYVSSNQKYDGPHDKDETRLKEWEEAPSQGTPGVGAEAFAFPQAPSSELFLRMGNRSLRAVSCGPVRQLTQRVPALPDKV